MNDDIDPSNTTPPSDPPPDMAALLEEIPRLYRARAFANALSEAHLLQRLGENLDDRDLSLARGYLEGLGFPDAEPALILNWQDAADAAESLDLNSEGWEAEEMLRASVTQDALERLDEEALTIGLGFVGEKAGEAARDAVAEAEAMWDISDPALLNAAAGAAVQAAHLAALALLASDDDIDEGDHALLDHPFMAKFRLFARGRWPIGLAGRTLNVF